MVLMDSHASVPEPIPSMQGSCGAAGALLNLRSSHGDRAPAAFDTRSMGERLVSPAGFHSLILAQWIADLPVHPRRKGFPSALSIS